MHYIGLPIYIFLTLNKSCCNGNIKKEKKNGELTKRVLCCFSKDVHCPPTILLESFKKKRKEKTNHIVLGYNKKIQKKNKIISSIFSMFLYFF